MTTSAESTEQERKPRATDPASMGMTQADDAMVVHVVQALTGPGGDADATASTLFAALGRTLALHLAQAMARHPAWTALPGAVAVRSFVLGIRLRAFGFPHDAVAAAHVDVAEALVEDDRPREASPHLTRALAIAEAEKPDGEAVASRMLDLAFVRLELADHEGALALALRARDGLLRSEPPVRPAAFVSVTGLLSAVALARGRLGEASDLACERLSAARTDNSLTAIAHACIALAEIGLQTEDPRVESLLAEAGTLLGADRADPDPSCWAALLAHGRWLTASGRYPEALVPLRRAARLAEEAFGRGHQHVRHAIRALAEVTLLHGPAVAVVPIMEDQIAWRTRAVGDHPDVAAMRVTLGQAFAKLGDAERAAGEFEAALRVQERHLGEEHPALARTLDGLVDLAVRAGRLARAMDLAERALSIRREILPPRHTDLARSLSALARIHTELGRHAEALERQDVAVDLLAGALDEAHPRVLEARAGRADILLRLGRIVEAEADLALVVDIRGRRLGPPFGPRHVDMARDLRDLGVVRLANGDTQGAIACFGDAGHLVEMAFGTIHPDLAGLRLGLAIAALREGDGKGAARLAASTLAVLAAHPHAEEEWRTLALLADVAAGDGRNAAAVAFGKLAVDDIQRVRRDLSPLDDRFRHGFMSDRVGVYRNLFVRLLDAGRLPEAMHVRSMMKRFELRDAVRHSALGTALEASAFTGAETAWIARGGTLRERICVLARQAEAIGDGVPHLPDQRALVQDRLDRRAAAIGELEKWVLDDVHDASGEPTERRRMAFPLALASGTAALDYVVSLSSTVIVLSIGDRRQAFTVAIAETALNALVADLWSALQDGGDPVPPARDLFDYLLGPVAEDLSCSGVDELLVSPDGALRHIPFAALHDGREFLVERYAVGVVTPGGSLGLGRMPRAGLAAFGTDGGGDLPSLPHVQGELRTVACSVPGRSTVDMGADFTEEALARGLAEAEVVHIAGHFRFLPAQDLDSWLPLGDGNRLTVERLLSERFDFDGLTLLALSGCETGVVQGQPADGRGMETLPALLRLKGVGAVLTSHWAVHDGGTAILMGTFYRNWRSSGLSMTQALRRAQIAMLHDGGPGGGPVRGVLEPDGVMASEFSHPLHWAAFALHRGD